MWHRIHKITSEAEIQNFEHLSKTIVIDLPPVPCTSLELYHQRSRRLLQNRFLLPVTILVAMSLLSLTFQFGTQREVVDSVHLNLVETLPAKKARRMSKFEKEKRPTRAKRYPFQPWDERLLYSNMNFALDRPLQILSLGGSVTWGGSLNNRYDAYPFLLAQLHEKSTVDNLAIRATGATFPSNCIQSMVDGNASPELENWSENEQSNEKIYDVILLEFSMNGFAGTTFLLKRLKRRYPDAVIIYVHLQSLSQPNLELTKEDVHSAVDQVEGLCYMFPEHKLVRNAEGVPVLSEESLQLYRPDMHHLSEIGHKVVAHGIISVLYQKLSIEPTHILRQPGVSGKLGSWGRGDQCYIWLTGGQFPKQIKSEGGKFQCFEKFLRKFAYEIKTGSKASFSFVRKDFNLPDAMQMQLPIHILHMSKTIDHSLYPQARITTNGEMTMLSSYPLDNLSYNHVARPLLVGMSKFGENLITIEPIQETERPFRLVGIMICGACIETNEPVSTKSMVIRIPEISFTEPR